MIQRFLKNESGSAFVLTLLVLLVLLTFVGMLTLQAMSIGARADTSGDNAASGIMADLATDHFKLEVDRIMESEYGGVPSDMSEVDPGVFMQDISVTPDTNHGFKVSNVGVLHRKNNSALEITFKAEGRAYDQVTVRDATLTYDMGRTE